MSRRRLAIGETGQIEATAQMLTVEGRWVKRSEGDTSKAGRWRARTYYRDQKGSRREVARYAPTQVRAVQALELAVQQIDTKRGDGRITPSTPFVQAGRVWLERIARPDSQLSARSVEDYTGTFKRYVDTPESLLYRLTLAEANDAQRLRAFLRHTADTSGNGASHMLKSVLGGILRTAVQDGVLTENKLLVVGKVKAVTVKETARDPERAMTRAERDHAVQVAYDLADAPGLIPRTLRKRQATADLLAVLAASGARIDEARFIRWQDVDLDSGRLHLDGTKSASADRVVNLPEWCLGRLKARADRMGQIGLVFPSPALKGGSETPWEASNSSKAVRWTLDQAGLPWATAHTFRHTTATLLHLAGIPLADIAATLGHRDIAQSLKYIGKDYGGSKAHIAAVL